MDIDRVSVGQSAVGFSVFKDAYLVSGVLTKLSADRIIDDGVICLTTKLKFSWSSRT